MGTHIDRQERVQGMKSAMESKGSISPFPESKQFIRSSEFLLNNIKQSMKFFNPEKCTDPNGGFYHFYNEAGELFDTDVRKFVTEARFIFTYAVAFKWLGDDKYKQAVEHGVKSLRDITKFRNEGNGAFFWELRNGVPTDKKILTYAIAFALLAYSKAVECGVESAREHVRDIYDLMEEHLWSEKFGLYAEEADENWSVTDYRSQSGNLHTCEALIAAYEATKEKLYLNRALLIAENICIRQAGLTKGLVWEHFNEDWSAQIDFKLDDPSLIIFRPWGFQPGHQVEWARFLLVLNHHSPAIWMVPKARYLFDTAVKAAKDPEHGGLAYSFDLNGTHEDPRLQASGHWDKVFWVQNEALGTAAMLAIETGDSSYWKWYEEQWKYVWSHFVDHQHGSWRRRMSRENVPEFTEKTHNPKCVDPDYHILGGFDGALQWMKMDLQKEACD